MKIKIQITVESDDGQPEVVQEVAHLDRGTLRPETLGLRSALRRVDRVCDVPETLRL
jgi:hypothetical protein